MDNPLLPPPLSAPLSTATARIPSMTDMYDQYNRSRLAERVGADHLAKTNTNLSIATNNSCCSITEYQR